LPLTEGERVSLDIGRARILRSQTSDFRYPVYPKKVFSIRKKIFWKKVFTFRRIYGIIRMYAIYASKCHKFKRKEELQYGKQNSC
jgi:hypothetical protein